MFSRAKYLLIARLLACKGWGLSGRLLPHLQILELAEKSLPGKNALAYLIFSSQTAEQNKLGCLSLANVFSASQARILLIRFGCFKVFHSGRLQPYSHVLE